MKSSMILLKALGDINDQYLNYENEERKKKIVIKLKYILVPVFMFVIVILGIVQFNNSNLVNKNIDKNNIFTIRVYGAEVENTYLTSNYIDENTGQILSPKIMHSNKNKWVFLTGVLNQTILILSLLWRQMLYG